MCTSKKVSSTNTMLLLSRKIEKKNSLHTLIGKVQSVVEIEFLFVVLYPELQKLVLFQTMKAKQAFGHGSTRRFVELVRYLVFLVLLWGGCNCSN